MAPAGRRRSRRSRGEAPLERLRRIVSAWPETDERLSHGAPTWWGGRKTFATYAENHHGDGRVAVWIKSDLDAQEALIEADPARFFVPPYVGPSGWVGAIIGGDQADDADWALVEQLLEQGYRAVAPKRAIRALDASRS